MYGFYGLTAFLFVAALATADVAEIGRIRKDMDVTARSGIVWSSCRIHEGQYTIALHSDRKEAGLSFSTTHTAARVLPFWSGKGDCGFFTLMNLQNELIR